MSEQIERLQVDGTDRLEIGIREADGYRWATLTTYGRDGTNTLVSVVEVADLLDWWQRVGRLLGGNQSTEAEQLQEALEISEAGSDLLTETATRLLERRNRQINTLVRQLQQLRRQLAEERADLPPVDKQLLLSLMHIVVMCDEMPDDDGLCECARAIGAALQRYDRRAKRARKQLATERAAREKARQDYLDCIQQMDAAETAAQGRAEQAERQLADAQEAVQVLGLKLAGFNRAVPDEAADCECAVLIEAQAESAALREALELLLNAYASISVANARNCGRRLDEAEYEARPVVRMARAALALTPTAASARQEAERRVVDLATGFVNGIVERGKLRRAVDDLAALEKPEVQG